MYNKIKISSLKMLKNKRRIWSNGHNYHENPIVNIPISKRLMHYLVYQIGRQNFKKEKTEIFQN